ncbi:MAG: glutathione-regulated potassium-efflux system protein KefB [Candidatus Micrarchaeota archaeon]|nr:MAG: glutathione-regulated potassium-efflux system protein KefB [Candidatus Micrarchaeota archaeon]
MSYINKRDIKRVRLVASLLGIALVIALISYFALYELSRSTSFSLLETIYEIFSANGYPYVQSYSFLNLNDKGFGLFVIISVIDGLAKLIAISVGISILLDVIISIKTEDILKLNSYANLKDHVIICGYGKVGESLAFALEKLDKDFVIMDIDKAKARTAHILGYKSIIGDFKYERDLIRAGIKTAKTIIFSSEDAYKTLLGITVARKLNSKIKIAAVAAEEFSRSKLHRAGADLVVIAEELAALEMCNILINRIKYGH